MKRLGQKICSKRFLLGLISLSWIALSASAVEGQMADDAPGDAVHWSPAYTQMRVLSYESLSLEELRARHDELQSGYFGFFNNELAYVRYALAMRFEGRTDDIGRAEYERWMSGAARNPIEWSGAAGADRTHGGLPEGQAALGIIMRENDQLCRARYYLSQALEAGYDRSWVQRNHDELTAEIEFQSVTALNNGEEPLRCYRAGD